MKFGIGGSVVGVRLFAYIGAISLSAILSGCTCERPEEAETENNSVSQTQEMPVSTDEVISDADESHQIPGLNAPAEDKPVTEATLAWKEIWSSQDVLASLKAFQEKYGLPMETLEEIGPESELMHEGPCGPTFTSLVKTTDNVDEMVWEINKEGKILRKWSLGVPKPAGLSGNDLFRRVQYYPELKNFGYMKQGSAEPMTFVLKISDAGKMEVLPQNTEFPEFKTEEISCPATPDIDSDYSYCVKQSGTERIFVLQHVCT